MHFIADTELFEPVRAWAKRFPDVENIVYGDLYDNNSKILAQGIPMRLLDSDRCYCKGVQYAMLKYENVFPENMFCLYSTKTSTLVWLQ